jgi:hypothetical protein
MKDIEVNGTCSTHVEMKLEYDIQSENLKR